jgi:uncharacterized protein
VPAAAWLRLWTKALLLAFITGRPLPAVPAPLRVAWSAQVPRLLECALATVADRAVDARAMALRGCYSPATLTRVVAGTGTDMLGGRTVPRAAGRVWVPPQLRWAHEAARVGWGRPARSAEAAADAAPPLDFALAGLPDWPGIPAGERLRMLLRHPLSLDNARNRELASIALYGEDGRAAFEAALAADLATALPAACPAAPAAGQRGPLAGRLSEAISRLVSANRGDRLVSANREEMPGCPSDWLVTVLEWPATG